VEELLRLIQKSMEQKTEVMESIMAMVALAVRKALLMMITIFQGQMGQMAGLL